MEALKGFDMKSRFQQGSSLPGNVTSFKVEDYILSLHTLFQ